MTVKTKNFTPGCILLWYGSVASIPSGYHLCNGLMDTPDLRNIFVVGAGDTYDPDDTGGSATHTHFEVPQLHDHDIPSGTYVQAGANYNLTVELNRFTFNTDSADGRPPFRALCYIMKIN